MAEEASGQEKTEDPTPKRLQDARKKGDVAKSMEIPSAAVLLAGLMTLHYSGNFMMDRLSYICKHYLGNLHTMQIIPDNIPSLAGETMLQMAIIMAPLMAVIMAVALISNYAQVGVLFTTEKIAPKFDKIDPFKGFARLFSKQMMANTIKSVLKLFIIALVAYLEVRKVMPGIMPLMDQEPRPIFLFMANTAFWIFLKSALIIAILAVADYAFQRWQFMEKMKMTKQEIKDEAKQTEGDPHVKGRIRAIQMEMARRRMMEEVPKADVVITNPTRLAIALSYDTTTMVAPKVIAKGAGFMAHRIKEVAKEHNVPLVEDKPLAQALFKEVKIDETIPENLFQAVAEVLAYVYSLKKAS